MTTTEAPQAQVSPQSILFAKIQAARENFGSFSKDKTADAGKYTYQYASLDTILAAVEPALKGQGLMILNSGGVDPNRITVAIADIATGMQIASSAALHKTDPQEVGKEITYFRRYLLCGLLNLMPEDDTDAQHTAARATAAAAAPMPQAAPPPPTVVAEGAVGANYFCQHCGTPGTMKNTKSGEPAVWCPNKVACTPLRGLDDNGKPAWFGGFCYKVENSEQWNPKETGHLANGQTFTAPEDLPF